MLGIALGIYLVARQAQLSLVPCGNVYDCRRLDDRLL